MAAVKSGDKGVWGKMVQRCSESYLLGSADIESDDPHLARVPSRYILRWLRS
jgi:hypothetical protein